MIFLILFLMKHLKKLANKKSNKKKINYKRIRKIVIDILVEKGIIKPEGKAKEEKN